MKKLLAIAFAALFSLSASAQQVDLRKKISVSGTSEMEVTPDIIYLSISLKEYLKDNNSKKKVDITTLENQLFAAVQKAGLIKIICPLIICPAITMLQRKRKTLIS